MLNMAQWNLVDGQMKEFWDIVKTKIRFMKSNAKIGNGMVSKDKFMKMAVIILGCKKMVNGMDMEHIMKRMARFSNKATGSMEIYRKSDWNYV